MHLSEFPPEADATPVTVINASAKPIFRITLKSLTWNAERTGKILSALSPIGNRGLLNLELISAIKNNMLSLVGAKAYHNCHWFHPRTLTAIRAFVVA